MTDRPGDDQGGDPVCWIHLTCPECGAIPGRGEEDLEQCPRCGAERSGAEGSAADR